MDVFGSFLWQERLVSKASIDLDPQIGSYWTDAPTTCVAVPIAVSLIMSGETLM